MPAASPRVIWEKLTIVLKLDPLIPLALLLAAKRPGLRLTALRGGKECAIEVRPRDGGAGVILPLAGAISRIRTYHLGLKRHGVAEAVARTGAGDILFSRRLAGGTSPARGGPDVAAMSWVSASIRIASRGAPGEVLPGG